MQNTRWTVQQLIEKSHQYLTEEGESQRINWKPNPRQIRYYVSLGLVDKPFGGRGYGNTYGVKHLLQLLSIKQLQHQGLKLAEIQPMLAGLSQERLASLLGFSLDWVDPEEPTSNRSESDFWKVVPPVTPPEAAPPLAPFSRMLEFELDSQARLQWDETVLSHMSPSEQHRALNEIKTLWQRLTRSERANP